MMNNFLASPQFRPGENAISIVSHPPEIHPGTPVRIVKPWYGNLFAIQLPDGEIHRWFAWFELRTQNTYSASPLAPGSYATVIESTGHGNPPHVSVGTTVRIVRCFPNTIFYDVMLSDGEYHRWLAEFELAKPI